MPMSWEIVIELCKKATKGSSKINKAISDASGIQFAKSSKLPYSRWINTNSPDSLFSSYSKIPNVSNDVNAISKLIEFLLPDWYYGVYLGSKTDDGNGPYWSELYYLDEDPSKRLRIAYSDPYPVPGRTMALSLCQSLAEAMLAKIKYDTTGENE